MTLSTRTTRSARSRRWRAAIASGVSPYLAQLVKGVTIPKDESKATASDIATNAMMGAIGAEVGGKYTENKVKDIRNEK